MSELLIAVEVVLSQSLFANAYGISGDDRAYAITETSDRGLAVAGWTNSFGAGGYDFLVFKIGSDGGLDWAKSFGGADNDYAYSITQSSDQGLAVAGLTGSFGSGNADVLVLKLASDGTLQWSKTFGGSSGEAGYAITETSDQGLAVAGLTASAGAGSADFLVLKLAPDGDLEWAKSFGGANDEQAYSIVQTSDGGFALVGYTKSFGSGSVDLLLMKLAPDGDLEWAKSFGGAASDYAYAITETSDQGLAVAGLTGSAGAGGSDFLILKLDSDGGLEWAKSFGGTGSDRARSIMQTPDQGLAVVGYTSSFGAGDYDLLLVKTDLSGSTEWAKTLGGSGNDYPYSVNQSLDSCLAVAGRTASFGQGNYDAFVLKAPLDGNYSDCLEPCTPQESVADLSETTPSVGADYTPNISEPAIQVNELTMRTDTICIPTAVLESPDNGAVSVRGVPVLGGALFFARHPQEINLYAADGRLARVVKLKKGWNQIALDRGVYLWKAGVYKGKVVIR